MSGDLGRRADADDFAAALAAIGPEIDDPIRGADQIQVVLDDQQGMPGGEQLAKGLQQLRDVLEVQSGGGLVEQEQFTVVRGAGDHGPGLREMSRQLEPLRLAARKSGHRLAELHILQANIRERRQSRGDLPGVLEELERFRHRHIQCVGDTCASAVRTFALDLQHLVAIAAAVAIGTAQIHVGEELHLDMLEAVTTAGRAATIARVEAERAGGVLALLCDRLCGKQGPDGVEGSHVARGIRASGAADRALIDHDHVVDELRSAQPGELAGRFSRFPAVLQERGIQNVFH